MVIMKEVHGYYVWVNRHTTPFYTIAKNHRFAVTSLVSAVNRQQTNGNKRYLRDCYFKNKRFIVFTTYNFFVMTNRPPKAYPGVNFIKMTLYDIDSSLFWTWYEYWAHVFINSKKYSKMENPVENYKVMYPPNSRPIIVHTFSIKHMRMRENVKSVI